MIISAISQIRHASNNLSELEWDVTLQENLPSKYSELESKQMFVWQNWQRDGCLDIWQYSVSVNKIRHFGIHT